MVCSMININVNVNTKYRCLRKKKIPFISFPHTLPFALMRGTKRKCMYVCEKELSFFFSFFFKPFLFHSFPGTKQNIMKCRGALNLGGFLFHLGSIF